MDSLACITRHSESAKSFCVTMMLSPTPKRAHRSCPAARLEAGLSVRHRALLADPGLLERPLRRQSGHRVRVQQGRDELLGRVRYTRPRLVVRGVRGQSYMEYVSKVRHYSVPA